MPSPKAHQLQRHHLRQYCFFSLIQVIEAALKLIKCNFQKKLKFKKIRPIRSCPVQFSPQLWVSSTTPRKKQFF